MNLTRRTFLVASTAAIAFPFAGCTDEAINIINTVLASAEAVLSVAEPGASWVTSFQNAVAALKSAEASWQAGSAVTIVISALNTLAAVAAVIPLTAVYSPLIDVLVAGIEAVLLTLPASLTRSANLNGNPHRGRVALTKPHFLQSRAGAYKEQFNKVAVGIGLAKAKIA